MLPMSKALKYAIKKGTIALALMLCASFLSGNTGFAEAAIPKTIRIGVIASTGKAAYKNAGIVKFTVQGNYQVIDAGALPPFNVLGDMEEGSSWQVAYLTTGIQVIRDGQPLIITPGPIVIQEKSHSGSNLVVLQSYTPNGSTTETAINKRYRGNMEFKLGSGYLTGINDLPLEEYLYGVVPREMSNNWPIEALKAQALAARTYAVANYNKRIALGFNLLDTPDDQAYGGYNSEGAQATQAVQETQGEIITYRGEPISAVYHSNSGGHTEDNENVWSGPALPYLRGKPDPYSLKCKFGSWTYETVATGTDALGRLGVQDKLRQIDPNFGTLADIELIKYPSGRVKKIIITDSAGYTIEKTGSEFGKLFNPSFYTYLNEQSFMSNFFSVEFLQQNSLTVVDAAGNTRSVTGQSGLMAVSGDGTVSSLDGGSAGVYGTDGTNTVKLTVFPEQIVFKGHGWGHGVGMSQWGAYQMAKEGKTYRDIITFYYTGVEISK